MASALLTFLGFAAYGAVHSMLLTESARLGLEALVGPRAVRGWFRLGFAVQAAALLGVYVGWVAGLPDVEWGSAAGLGKRALQALRLGALGFILVCVARIGAGEFLGWAQFRAWQRGEVPDGDGLETGRLVVAGPYRWVRHPMYSALLVALWAEPRWSANRFAFTVAASLYLWLGSVHEERRLDRFYGRAYRRYRECTPRFVPRLPGRR